MNDHARLVLTLWQATSDFVPANLRDDAAEALIRSYMDAEDVEAKELFDMSGDCVHLDAALEALEEEIEEVDQHHDDDPDGLFD